VELNGDTFFMGQPSLDLIDENVEGMPVRVWDWHWQSVPESVAYSRVEFAGHMALLVRMEAAARVRHDPRMLAGGDDIDYSLALRKAGFSMGIAHRAKMVHRSLNEQDAEGFRTFDRVLSSWRCFYNKWGFVRRGACFEAGVTSQEWLRLVIQPQAAPAQAVVGVKPGFGP
jgi:GT2 family glycosyltransferase